MPSSLRATHRVTVTAVALLSLVLAACSTAATEPGVATLRSPGAATADDGAGAPSPSLATDPQEAILAFARCMREHGIDMPDPQVGEGGRAFFVQGRAAGDDDGADPDVVTSGPDPASEEFQAAQEACRPLMEGFQPPQIDPEQRAEMAERMLAFAGCMREHGIDFPDPRFGQDGGFSVTIGGDEGDNQGPRFDPRSEGFQAASEACRAELGADEDDPAFFGGPPPDGGSTASDDQGDPSASAEPLP